MAGERRGPGVHARLLREARPWWPHIAGVFALGLLATPLALLGPVPLKIIVDSVLSDAPLPGFLTAVVPGSLVGTAEGNLLVAIGLLLLTALLVRVQSIGSWLLNTWTSQRMVLAFRARLFRHAQRLSLSYHDERGTSDSTYRILYDAPSIQHVAINGVVPLLTSLVTFVGMVVVTASLSLHLAVVALAVAPVLVVATHYFGKKLKHRWRRVKKLESSAMSVIQQPLGSLRVVKAFGREEHEEDRFSHVSTQSVREHIRVATAEGTFGIVIGLTIAGGTAAVMWLGVNQIRAGTLTLGEFLLVMAYLAQMYEPLRTASKKFASLQGALTSAERAFELLDEDREVTERPDARPLVRAVGDIVFEDVTFSYDGVRPAISHVRLEVPMGTRVGIAGHTGAGKTTLVSLLMRFYDPSSGRILLDGVDLRDFRVEDLRRQFAIVLQEPVLFASSVAQNIAYARPGATHAEIVEAAKAANADGFITALPDGYETVVGERGMKLSGGERQRISLARAFLKDAPVLILDEPTSSVDARTEEGILEALDRLMQGRTTFMIAHRLDTLRTCDLRVQLDSGRVTVSNHAAALPLTAGQRHGHG